jgi:predicted transcriptional regulator of viral defense system
MKKAYSLPLILERVQKLGPSLGGVFLFSDLCNLIGAPTDVANAKVVGRLIRQGVLQKIQRGVYATKEAELWLLGSRIKPEAYISMDSVLAKNGLIGTIPARSVSLVYPGRKLVLETSLGLIRFFSIKRDLIFGLQTLTGGIKIADSEKAYLDLLYFYTKGARFVIDPLNEVNLTRLNLRKVKKYLARYKNPKFIQFVKGQIDEID